jgi:hypothetical protein
LTNSTHDITDYSPFAEEPRIPAGYALWRSVKVSREMKGLADGQCGVSRFVADFWRRV